MKHICQGPNCHTYDTQSRIRGTKGNKVLRTRNARYDINDSRCEWAQPWEQYFCDERCMNNWLAKHMTQLINFVGIKTKPQETPVEIVETVHQDWRGHDYTRTTIKLLNEAPENYIVEV